MTWTASRLVEIPRVGAVAVGGGRMVIPVTRADAASSTSVTELWEVFVDGRSPRLVIDHGSSADRPSQVSR